jgi:NifU-like protein involved in Fe-S cluster formation
MDYSSEVLRRFESPLRAGELAEELPTVARGEAEDRSLNLWARFDVRAENGVVRAVRFQLFGCPHAVAAADWIAEWLEGRELADLERLDVRAVARELDIPQEKLGKLLRIEDALLACRARLAIAAPGTGPRRADGSPEASGPL